MVAIGRSSNAFFFDGVSDSIIIPQGRFTSTGSKEGKHMTSTLQGTGDVVNINAKGETEFIIETWVVPDCGGVIAHREGQFTLEFGTVDTPGPAKFTVHLSGSSHKRVITTAKNSTTRWDGVVYPPQDFGGVHDSYNRYDTSNYGDVTNLNFNNRPLYHVVAALINGEALLAVNGEIVAKSKVGDIGLARSTAPVYIGGKGGEFRGAIEAIHITNERDEEMFSPSIPVKSEESTALFRFEEPVDVVDKSYSFTAFTANTDGTTTTMTVSTTDAQELIARLTGKAYDSTSPTVDFTATPYSTGKYKVVDYYSTPGTTSTISVAHTPYNLLINPGAINRTTHKPNQKPPERVRVHSINGSTGVITISSIHIDFVNGTNGLRGFLHSRTTDVDNYFVVVGADLLIDNGTGKPYQPPHYGTQIFDKTGQMVIDESDFENHGLVYSSRMATTDNDTNNPFAVQWPSTLDTLFQVGHSGRHMFSHITGHEYMRRFPAPSDLVVDQQADGSADIVQMSYDDSTRHIDEMFVMNSLIDFYTETLKSNIVDIENSSPISSVVDNGLPAAKKEMIAIGGSGFNYSPFFLKGPVPYTGTDINADTRLYHLIPETESRVAILHVPALSSTYDFAPLVEVHYNAIDLTGASMGVSNPMLMVEKTVPAGNTIVSGATRLIDVITTDIANATLYSPGGRIILGLPNEGYASLFTESHSLIGDNTGGDDYDIELDYSKTPELYTPPASTDAEPASPPKPIKRSHNTGKHPSVYHKLCIEPETSTASNTLTNFVIDPITEKSATAEFDISPTSSMRAFEMFDIIDNIVYEEGNRFLGEVFVQPSNKLRSNQLSQIRTLASGSIPNVANIMFLMSRCRIRGVKNTDNPADNSSSTTVVATGIAESFVNENVSGIGSGSPDSHIVKEIEPNAPVVTVTLGGVGQGAMNTKPTFDPSPLMRLPGSTRRQCAVQAVSVSTASYPGTVSNMSVKPLNNGSPDLASWGTICFPKKGRIYLDSGASAEYDSKLGAGFLFSDVDALANRTFVDGAGTAYSTFHAWCNAVGIYSQSSAGSYHISTNVFNDGDFGTDSLAQDGSTVNDRLFQSLDTVTHDYQLGTQFASTRAMVEIPVFPQQFFDHTELGIFPGPDNSMKLHIDATYTAQTWNPTPVGRRPDDIGVADKTKDSAHSYLINNQNHVSFSTIQRIEVVSNDVLIYVSHPKMFPDASHTVNDFSNLKGIKRLRRVFLPNGAWAVYNNDPASNGYLRIPVDETGSGDAFHDGYTSLFQQTATAGMKIYTAHGFRNETLLPLASDVESPSSDFEGRSPNYFDAANVMTQGGNLDYGLRQYVSAVEFKAGPLANPHAPRTQTGRAKSRIVDVAESAVSGGGVSYNLVLEDASLFPDVPYSRDSSNNITFEQGDIIYIAEIRPDGGTPVELYYQGKLNSFDGDNTIQVLDYSGSSFVIIDQEITLKRAGHNSGFSATYALSQEELKASTFKPTDSNEEWTFAAAYTTSVSVVEITNTNNNRIGIANSIGINIRKGDKIFSDDGTTIAYVGEVSKVESNLQLATNNTKITLTANVANAISSGDDIRIGTFSVMEDDHDALLNRSWYYPYAQGGLRNGDTVWMNMTLNNPHAVEGLFAKSRGVFNEALVWKGFNGGVGTLANRPRDSIPLENFLIGDSCLETAQNFAQHVNKTIEMNYEAMGLTASQAPVVAYVDPYMATEGHARVLLYDVGHDREFIAFHDIHMQVQSSAATPTIGYTRDITYDGGTEKLDKILMQVNGGAPHYLSTQIDVANGFPSENRFLRSTQQSKFIESAYAHDIPNSISDDLTGLSLSAQNKYTLANPLTLGNNPHKMGRGHGHFVHTGLYHEETSDTHTVGDSTLPRVQPAVASIYHANALHSLVRKENTGNLLLKALKSHRASQNPATHSLRDGSTAFDTPDGTRVISAFLCLKGKRNVTLDLANHDESRLQHLKHWTQMDFVRRMTIDLGEVGVKEGVTDIEAAAREMVRIINQGSALNGRTHARRPSHQYPGESERLDLTRIGVRRDSANSKKDPTSPHINADFAATGSTYDPAPFWYEQIAFDTHDRGSHMGYVRAHIGRVVEDINGTEGFSIVIHSTVPGASGRNFAVWLDNSKGQSSYQPQFLIGHGGRFRNFWCQPDEVLGENMHPAPMPLNKHGRPFAPVTTLRELTPQEEPNEELVSNHDVGTRMSDTANPIERNISARLGGISQNTVNDESFEAQSPSTTLSNGLRAGSTAAARINFGGLVASGVPGFSPVAGKHGLGRKGDRHFDVRYSEATQRGQTAPTDLTAYTGHVKANDVIDVNIGATPIYGFRFTDHRGQGYGVRYIYKEIDTKFANDLTTIPSTIEEEVCIFFDDKDVSQGGFTIGQHMLGYGDATGRLEVDTAKINENSWRGNKWNGVYAPDAGISCGLFYDASAKILYVKLEAPYGGGSTVLNNHPDILGYIGFPKEGGVVQLTDPFENTVTTAKGSVGNVFSYQTRTETGVAGQSFSGVTGSNLHAFFGVEADSFTTSHSLSAIDTSTATLTDSTSTMFHATTDVTIAGIITPRLNWTTLVTDELLAAVTAEAINLTDPNREDGISFDCRDMYCADGRTFGEWGVAADAIKIRAINPQKGVRPLSQMFAASVHPDLGIEAPHLEFGEYEKLDDSTNGSWTITASNAVNKPTSDADLDAHKSFDCGYIPSTVLQIRTKSRGYHTNTATPILVDSYNDPVSTTKWVNGLKGISYTSISGDHILPKIDNAMTIYASHSHTSGVSTFTLNSGYYITNLLVPANQYIKPNNYDRLKSFSESKIIWHKDDKYALFETVRDGSTATESVTKIIAEDRNANPQFLEEYGSSSQNTDGLLMTNADKGCSGVRSYGSVESEPITYFRGGRDSNDHSVPLYFGGGFSGVVLDVNDGSQNDYSDFYTHPYSKGPTGTAGIQNANEISTSYAILDCNALLAFFPATAMLNQHRGSINSPVYNKDSILSPDIDKGTHTAHSTLPAHVTARYTAGIVQQRSIPVVMRFPHQTARYADHKNSVDYFTTYAVYGPGQAFPFTETTDADAAVEPHPGYVVTTGNSWSKVPYGMNLPNDIKNSDGEYGPPSSTYQSRRHDNHWNTTLNWSPAEGIPSGNAGGPYFYGLAQGPAHGYHYGEHFNTGRNITTGNIDDYRKAHPLQHCTVAYYGVAMSADMTYHMDGGYHPGGSWLDNQISFNAPVENSDYRVAKINNDVNPTAFRVSGVMAETMILGASAETSANFNREIIVVDGTRCQNGEELATIIGQAINENPGKGALKAMGGTFAPSMGNAMRQDRYGWVEMTFVIYQQNSGIAPDGGTILVTTDSKNYVEAYISGATQDTHEQIPASGWIRTDKGGRNPVDSNDTPMYGPYHSRDVFYDSSNSRWAVRFWLAPNRISGMALMEDVTTYYLQTGGATLTFPNPVATPPTKVFVWSKAGVHYYNNYNDSTRKHMTQVHFNGLVDAIDRTRPAGAVGWAGERYSYLNSLRVGTEGYGAGLGAWHPKLGFSPYGSASSAMSTFGHLPHIAPMKLTPESPGPITSVNGNDTLITTPYDWDYTATSTPTDWDLTFSAYSGTGTTYGTKPIHLRNTDDVTRSLHHPQGVFSRGFVVVSYEGELALVAKHDRDGIKATGDWLTVVSKTGQSVSASDAIKFAGTARWDERIHNASRFVAPANAGPNIEALIVDDTATPTADEPSAYTLHGSVSADTELVNAEPCFAKTGDIFFDLDESPASIFLTNDGDVERNLITDYSDSDDVWLGHTNAYKLGKRSPAKNFSVEHVVWKRMDGGNLSLPAVNARGMGSVPFITRVQRTDYSDSSDIGTAYETGEKIYGINRFSFETTNSAMFPIIQAQELSHPQIAVQHPIELRNVLSIPNEEMQFAEVQVEDDTGQVHVIEGGSPFGTIVRTFNAVSDRSAEGLAPAVANSGVEPNMKVRLPDPDTIPGNIIVRSGFDRLQAYQNETMGSGGMIRPLSKDSLKHLFTDETKGPRLGGTFGDVNWEHISQSATGEAFPDSTYKGWETATGHAPLESSYELHDRTLFFHVTKCGNTHSHRYPNYYTHSAGVSSNELTAVSYSGTTLTVNTAPNASLYDEFIRDPTPPHRRFLRLYDPVTDRGGVASFTGISGSTFTGCVGDADFAELITGDISTYKVVPSYYIPAGSTRFFASRRMRDHAEVSGNSPDMAHTQYFVGASTELGNTVFSRPKMTPIPLPRMGHHFVNPTMAVLPGHFAHPAYQGLYNKHRAIRSATVQSDEYTIMEEQSLTNLKSDISTTLNNEINPLDGIAVIGSLNATPSGPSDIHGGAFTLLFETKVRNDGYGILASVGTGGTNNSNGKHILSLEANSTFTLKNHFPDPAEVGAYQIVIQPNIHKSQLIGFHQNGPANDLPDGTVEELTSQQVALVIGVDYGLDTLDLILAEATMADTRGCEVFVNELIIDHDPDYGSQFTNIPPLMLYNPLGVQGTESPSLVRRSLPYQPQMFIDTTPGMTTNIPWWSIAHRRGPDDSTAYGFRHLTHHKFDNYYEFIRANAGSIATQITLAGYPSTYPDVYSSVLENVSVNPVCTVVSVTSTTITVDDARGFPKVPYYGNKLVYTDANGVRRTHTYTERSGLDSTNMNKPKQFTIVANSDFTSNLTVGTKLRLTRAYDSRPAFNILKDSQASMITRVLPQMLQGSRDTNSLHLADAFLCLWHPNLGRPHTYYSDASRTWLNPLLDRAINKEPLNSMPEHFETIHYHDATYYASPGPFNYERKTPQPVYKKAADVTTNAVQYSSHVVSTKTITVNNAFSISDGDNFILDGRVYTVNGAVSGGTTVVVDEVLPNEITSGSYILLGGDGTAATTATIIGTFTGGLSSAEYTFQGETVDSEVGIYTTLQMFWPCGSRGGPQVSRLDGYGYVSSGWIQPRNYGDGIAIWDTSSGGLDVSEYNNISSPKTTRPFGFRFGLRQPYNKPQWSTYGVRSFIENAITSTNISSGYPHGPLVQQDGETWTYAGGASESDGTYPNTYIGIMERQTNFSGMLGVDKYEWQVRYSDGTRFTRPFGCPVRTLRNRNKVLRDWWGDHNGKGIYALDEAIGYYLVDWWGNTRGEDVRRHPVRAFGIRPAWDAADVYEYDRDNDKTPYARLYNGGDAVVNLKGLVDSSGNVSVSSGYNIPRFGGRLNDTNNNNANILVDVYMPTNAHRVGDDGNGRGLRYPTAFNEDVLTDLDEPIHTTGVVLSHHTAEPILNDGFIRARNDVLQADEVPRGISARLDIAEDGLLKPEAVVSDRTETISGESPHKDAVSRSSPRIGLDTEYVEGVDENMIIINTEAHSLHADRNVGQRVIMQGGYTAGSQTLGNYDLSALTFAGNPQGGAMKLSHTSNFNPLGGTYIAETRNFVAPISDSGWGAFTDATCDTNHTSGLSDGSTTSVRHITMDSTAKLVVGMTVTGTGIPASATVAAINNATCFTLSADTTATNSNTTLVFGPPTGKGSNPYATSTFDSSSSQTNMVDKSIKYMMRPVRMLDKYHVEMFRPNNNLHSSAPQYGSNYFSATGGGKYGMYLYEVSNGRATSGGTYVRSTSPNANPPYAPAYVMSIGNSVTVPISKGPTIIGTAESSFDNTVLDNEITRVIMSENTLQHHRSDAPRRRSSVQGDKKQDRMDYSVKPRFSQSLHQKGHKGDVDYNSNDHSGDAS